MLLKKERCILRYCQVLDDGIYEDAADYQLNFELEKNKWRIFKLALLEKMRKKARNVD